MRVIVLPKYRLHHKTIMEYFPFWVDISTIMLGDIDVEFGTIIDYVFSKKISFDAAKPRMVYDNRMYFKSENDLIEFKMRFL